MAFLLRSIKTCGKTGTSSVVLSSRLSLRVVAGLLRVVAGPLRVVAGRCGSLSVRCGSLNVGAVR